MLGREKTHDKWLEEHPGKSSEKHVEVATDEDERDRVRVRMEQDLDEKRRERGSE
jgi:hypothetical protein